MFILPGFMAIWMGWLLVRAFTKGQVLAQGGIFVRAKEPLWFWLVVALYAVVFLVSGCATLVLLWNGAFPSIN